MRRAATATLSPGRAPECTRRTSCTEPRPAPASRPAPGRATKGPGAAQRRRRRDAGTRKVPVIEQALPCGHWSDIYPASPQVPPLPCSPLLLSRHRSPPARGATVPPCSSAGTEEPRHLSQAATALPCPSAGTDEPRHLSQAATALPCSSAGTDEPRHLSQAVLKTGGTLSSPVPHTGTSRSPGAHPSKGDGHRRPELQNHRRHPPARLDL